MTNFEANNIKTATIPSNHIYADENGIVVATVIDDGKFFYAIFEEDKQAFEHWVKNTFISADGDCFAKIIYSSI